MERLHPLQALLSKHAEPAADPELRAPSWPPLLTNLLPSLQMAGPSFAQQHQVHTGPCLLYRDGGPQTQHAGTDSMIPGLDKQQATPAQALWSSGLQPESQPLPFSTTCLHSHQTHQSSSSKGGSMAWAQAAMQTEVPGDTIGSRTCSRSLSMHGHDGWVCSSISRLAHGNWHGADVDRGGPG